MNAIRIRSKCNWYENGEKSTELFLNVEKYCATQGCLCTIIVNKKELNDSQQINVLYIASIKLFLRKNYPYRKNAYRLLCHQQLHISLFGITSIFKLVIKGFICIISRTGI